MTDTEEGDEQSESSKENRGSDYTGWIYTLPTLCLEQLTVITANILYLIVQDFLGTIHVHNTLLPGNNQYEYKRTGKKEKDGKPPLLTQTPDSARPDGPSERLMGEVGMKVKWGPILPPW